MIFKLLPPSIRVLGRKLLVLPHGVLSVAVELALVIHDHIEVTFEEGGRSWWVAT
jgi:hypothetical protein